MKLNNSEIENWLNNPITQILLLELKQEINILMKSVIYDSDGLTNDEKCATLEHVKGEIMAYEKVLYHHFLQIEDESKYTGSN